MPITQISTFQNLSNDWTIEDIASEALVLTNNLDNEDIELSNVRVHIKVSQSHIVRELNIANSPFYGIWMEGTFENSLHASGLEFCDLSTVVSGFTPATVIQDIKRINIRGDGSSDEYISNLRKEDVSKLTMLNSNLNNQFRQSVLWTWHGSELLFYVGDDINSVNITRAEASYDISDHNFLVWAHRRPILDDMLAENASATYRSNIDLPDDNINLLLMMVQKKILEQVGRTVPEQLNAQIDKDITDIRRGMSEEIQMELAKRNKTSYEQR